MSVGQVPTQEVPFPEAGVSTKLFPAIFFLATFGLYLWWTRGK